MLVNDMRRVRETLSPTRRLTILYITALSTVALLTLFGQAVISIGVAAPIE